MLFIQVVDLCKGRISPLTGEPIRVVAAGGARDFYHVCESCDLGIFDHRGLAAALCMGADAVWVGTRYAVCWQMHAF